jgi:hypothetical protein
MGNKKLESGVAFEAAVDSAAKSPGLGLKPRQETQRVDQGIVPLPRLSAPGLRSRQPGSLYGRKTRLPPVTD